ncbi:MAG: cyclohexanone monooxygenase, partial [Burkholderiales bacterium]
DYTSIEPETTAEERWGARVREAADATIIPETDSWWVGANIPGKPRVILRYIGGALAYQNACADVAAKDYEGFTFTRASVEAVVPSASERRSVESA